MEQTQHIATQEGATKPGQVSMTTATKVAEIEDLLGKFKGRSRPQLAVILMTYLWELAAAGNLLGSSFIAATPDHRCALPPGVNASVGIPTRVDRNGVEMFEKCTKYGTLTAMNNTAWEDSIDNATMVPCGSDGWWYSNEYKETITTEWDLVCDRAILSHVGTSVLMFGCLIGSFVIPLISDYIGRRKIILACGISWAILGVAAAFTTNIMAYGTLLGICGGLNMGAYLVLFCLVCEWYPTSQRAMASMTPLMGWTLGVMSLPGVAYFVRNWRHQQIVFHAPLLLVFIVFWFVLESPRWLQSKDRLEEAEAVLKEAARSVGTTLPEFTLRHLCTTQPATPTAIRSYPIIGIFATPYLRINALILMFVWFVSGCVYYGLSLGTHTLAGNQYLNFFLSGVVELPAYFTVMYALDSNRFGRRIPIALIYIFTGIQLIIIYFIPAKTVGGTSLTWLSTALYILGKYGIATVFAGVYLLVSEVFPTAVRNSGLGVCSTFARVGAIMAPYTVYLKSLLPELQPILLGGLALAAGALILLLPETSCRSLPGTLEDYGQWLKIKRARDHEQSAGSKVYQPPAKTV